MAKIQTLHYNKSLAASNADAHLSPAPAAPAPPSRPHGLLTQINLTAGATIITSSNGRTTKAFSRNADGTLDKRGAGNISAGMARRVSITNLETLAATLDGLQPNEAITYGLHAAEHDPAALTTQGALLKTPGAIARDRDHFAFTAGAPGVLMLDIDYCELSPDELIGTIRSLHPALEAADILWRASASAGVYSLDDQIDTGLSGQRCYLLIDDAARIPEIGAAIQRLIWAHGFGRYAIGSAGQLLERGLIDASVWQPERLDFAAPPLILDSTLGRAVPDAFISRGTGDGTLYADALQIDDAIGAKADEAKAEAKTAALHSPERAAIKGAYVERESARMAKREGISDDEARAAVGRRLDGNLGEHDRLITDGGREVRVGDLLKNPQAWHGTRFADPLEPSYRGDRRIAVFYSNPDGSGILYSHAHGGTVYRIGKVYRETKQDDHARPENQNAKRGATEVPETVAPRSTSTADTLADPQGPNHIGPSLADDLEELAYLPDAAAAAEAKRLAIKHAWRCSWQLSADALKAALCKAAPSASAPAITSAIQWRLGMGAQDALGAISITGDARHIHPADLGESASGIGDEGGIVALKAPHGSGKTKNVLAPITREALQRSEVVVAITGRAALCGANAGVLGLTDYREAGGFDGGLSICINSICNPRFSAWTTQPDVLLIDEGAAVLRELHGRGSTMGSDAPAIRQKLADMIGGARLVVLADADIADDDLAVLREITQGRAIKVIVADEQARPQRAEFTDEARVLSEIIAAALAGSRVCVAADSARHAELLGAYLRAALPGKRVRAIHSRNSAATSGRADTLALLKDINAGIDEIDILIYSPVVESGISIEHEHFDKHFALFTGAAAPAALNQQLLRDRTATDWLIGIVGAGTRGEPSATAADHDALHAKTGVLNQAITGLGITAANAFDSASTRYAAVSERAGASYGQALWLTLEARGWTCTRGRRADAEERARAKAIRIRGTRLANDEAAALVLGAPDLTADGYKALREQYSISQIESAALARFEIQGLFGIVTRREIALYQRGKLAGQLAKFRLLRQGAPAERDSAQAEHGLVSVLRAYDAATAAGCRALFAKLGIDPDDEGTSDGVLTAAGALDGWQSLQGTDEGAALERAGICRFRSEPKAPITWVSRALKKFGLSLSKLGQTRADGRLYQIERDCTINDDTGEITTAGWDVMAALEGGTAEYLARNTSDSSALSPKCDGLQSIAAGHPPDDPDGLIDALLKAISDSPTQEWGIAA